MPKAPRPVQGVYEREPGVWCGRYRTREGKLVRKTFGRDRQAAINWVEAARTLRRNPDAVLPSSAKHSPKKAIEAAALEGERKEEANDAITVGRLCDELLLYVQTHIDEYRDQKNPPRRIKEIKAHFGERVAAELKTSEVEEWLDGVQEDRELAPATYNKLRGTFSMLYKHGKRRDLVDVNSAANVPLQKVGEGIERFLTIDEEKRLRAVLQAQIELHAEQQELSKHTLHRLLEFDVSIRTGMRKSEQFNLRWRDVDFDRRIMRLRKTKSGKARNAYMIEDVVRALRQIKELELDRRSGRHRQVDPSLSDMVFAKAENKKWWLPALKEAKIEKYRWHDNRHTFCSRLVQNGVHLKVVQEAAGHASIASTMRYAHFAPSQVLDALSVLNWDQGVTA